MCQACELKKVVIPSIYLQQDPESSNSSGKIQKAVFCPKVFNT